METLVKAEKGILPDPKFLIRISAAFDVNPSELILNEYLIPKKHELNYAIELMNLLSMTQILNRKLMFERESAAISTALAGSQGANKS